MSTLEGLRSRVRLRLEEAVEAIWDDAIIDEAIGASLEEYNHLFPREERVPVSHAGGQGPLEIEGNTTGVVRVVLANGWTLPRRSIASGNPAGEAVAWEWFAGALHFSQPLEAQSVDVWRLTPHSIEQVPEWDYGLLVLGAVWRTLQQRSVQEVKRGLFMSVPAAHEVVRAAEREYSRALRQRQRRARSRVMGAV